MNAKNIKNIKIGSIVRYIAVEPNCIGHRVGKISGISSSFYAVSGIIDLGKQDITDRGCLILPGEIQEILDCSEDNIEDIYPEYFI